MQEKIPKFLFFSLLFRLYKIINFVSCGKFQLLGIELRKQYTTAFLQYLPMKHRIFISLCFPQGSRENSPAHWYKSRGVVRASMKARQMITWILGKEDSKFKNCENLQVL